MLDFYGFFRINGSVIVVILMLIRELESRRRYFVNVIVVNGVGL